MLLACVAFFSAQEYHDPFYGVEFHQISVQWKPRLMVDLMRPFVEI